MTFWKTVNAIIVAVLIITFSGAIIRFCFWLGRGGRFTFPTQEIATTAYGPYVVVSTNGVSHTCKDQAGNTYVLQTPAGFGTYFPKIGEWYMAQPAGGTSYRLVPCAQ